MAGRVFFDCNQYEVAFADEVKEDVRNRNNALTETAAYYLDKAIALFNAIVLVKNVNLPDSVATDLEELGAGSPVARVTARNTVLKNLWASFWHIVPNASSDEMELWIQFSVQVWVLLRSMLTLPSCLAAIRATGSWRTVESKLQICQSQREDRFGERTFSQTAAALIKAVNSTRHFWLSGIG